MQMQQTPPMQQPKDIANMFKNEKEFLEVGHHEWALKEIELKYLRRHQRMLDLEDDEAGSFSKKKLS
jgi:hypothetical protein